MTQASLQSQARRARMRYHTYLLDKKKKQAQKRRSKKNRKGGIATQPNNLISRGLMKHDTRPNDEEERKERGCTSRCGKSFFRV